MEKTRVVRKWDAATNMLPESSNFAPAYCCEAMSEEQGLESKEAIGKLSCDAAKSRYRPSDGFFENARERKQEKEREVKDTTVDGKIITGEIQINASEDRSRGGMGKGKRLEGGASPKIPKKKELQARESIWVRSGRP